MVELLRAESEPAEPHILKNLVTHDLKISDCHVTVRKYARRHVSPNAKTKRVAQLP